MPGRVSNQHLLLWLEVKLLSTGSRARLLRERARAVERGWMPPPAARILKRPHAYEIALACMRFLDTPTEVELIDVGANNGSWAERFAESIPVRSYVGVEPDPRAFRQLSERFPRGRLLNAAAGLTAGTASLHLARESTYSSLVEYRDFASSDVDAENEAETTVVPLDDVIDSREKQGPRILKIDVQGSEADVLRGATEVLRTVDLMILESPLFSQTAKTNDLGTTAALVRPYGLAPAYFARPGLRFGRYTLPVEYDVIFARDTLPLQRILP